jgi:hypothetical protein
VSFFPSLLLPPPKPSILSSPTPRNHPLPPPSLPLTTRTRRVAHFCVCARSFLLDAVRRWRTLGAAAAAERSPQNPGGAPPKRGTLLVLTPPMTQWMEKNTTCACLQQPTDWLKRAIATVLFCAVWFFFIRCVFLTFYSAAAGNLVLSSTLSFLNIILSFALQKILLF